MLFKVTLNPPNTIVIGSLGQKIFYLQIAQGHRVSLALHCCRSPGSSLQLRVRAVQVEFVARIEGDLDGAVVGLLLEMRCPLLGWAKRWSPGCVNAAGKARQKW